MPFLCRRGGKQRVCLDDAKMHRMSGQPESWLRWKGCCDTVFPPCRRGALAEPAAWPVLDLAVLRDLPVGGGSVTICHLFQLLKKLALTLVHIPA